MKIKLFIDFDDTIVESSKRAVQLFNKKYNTNKKIEDSRLYNMSDIFPELTQNDFIEVFSNPEFFNDELKKIKNVEKFLKKMSKKLDYHIVTLGTEKNLELKEKWCKENFDFEYNFVGLTDFDKKKTVVDMSDSIFIDDKIDMLETANSLVKILYIGDLKRDTNNPDNIKIPKTIIPVYNWKNAYKTIKMSRDVLEWRREKICKKSS